MGVPAVAQWVKNPTSITESKGLILASFSRLSLLQTLV